MAEIRKDALEDALSNDANVPKISKDEEIGFHKGVLDTLSKERMELFKMIQNVEALMGMHLKRLEDLGVKITTQKSQK